MRERLTWWLCRRRWRILSWLFKKQVFCRFGMHVPFPYMGHGEAGLFCFHCGKKLKGVRDLVKERKCSSG